MILTLRHNELVTNFLALDSSPEANHPKKFIDIGLGVIGYEKMKENQSFTSLDVVTVVSLVIAVLSLAGAVLASVALDSSVSQARLGAEKLASQILMGGFESSKSDELGRDPASMTQEQRLELLGSSGSLSRDPWGQPYSYRIGSDSRGRRVAVVWSYGENQKPDTEEFKVDDKGNFIHMDFFEDDVGVVLSK